MSDYLVKCLSKGVADVEQQQGAADRIEKLEAKLAKAVEDLQTIKDRPEFRLPSSQNIASATLAALKGQDDE